MRQGRFLTGSFLLVTFFCTAVSPMMAQPMPVSGPNAPVQQPLGPPLSLAELEKLIGGRTTLELNFKNADDGEVIAALAKSSGLRFVRLNDFRNLRVMNAGAVEAPRHDAIVPKMDFWPAVRLWSRSEVARIKSEGEAMQRQMEKEEPHAPQAEAGQPITPEAQQRWLAQREEWFIRQTRQMQRFTYDRGVSVSFDPNLKTWSLSPGNEIATGRALNTWPLLILATGFQRHQNLSLQENEPQEKSPQEVQKTIGDQAIGEKAVQDAQGKQGNLKGAETIEGGQLMDGLSLNLSVFLEPKLLDLAQVRVLVSEARDDAGEEILSEREKNGSAVSFKLIKSRSVNSGGVGRQVELRPRQSKGRKLALVRGVVLIRYPTQIQQGEITDFSAPQNFTVGGTSLPASAQFEPPHLKNGVLHFGASVVLSSETGGRALLNRLAPMNSAGEGVFGEFLLPDPTGFIFTDTQGRTWSGAGMGAAGAHTALKADDGFVITGGSPPPPPPDTFTYTEERPGALTLVSAGATSTTLPGQVAPSLSVEELAKVRFTKVVFTTESDWRTFEVPFELRDLPLPPR